MAGPHTGDDLLLEFLDETGICKLEFLLLLLPLLHLWAYLEILVEVELFGGSVNQYGVSFGVLNG